MDNGKILVVGATGRVGGAAVGQLLKAGFEVRALVRRAGRGARLRSLGAEVAVGDATAPDTLVPAVQGCSGIFSALGAGPGRGGSETVEYRGNLNLLSAARSAGVGRFVYSSVLRLQLGPYGGSSPGPEGRGVPGEGPLRTGAAGHGRRLFHHPAPGDIHGDARHDVKGTGSLRPRAPAATRLLDRRPRYSPSRRPGYPGGHPGPPRDRRPRSCHLRRGLQASRKGPWKKN